MKQKTILIRLLILMLIATISIAACSGDSDDDKSKDDSSRSSDAVELERNQYIVIGDISNDPIEKIEDTQPIADYLASQLSDYGIVEGRVVVASSIEEMSELIANGAVDLYFDSAYPVALVLDAGDSHPVLRRSRKDVAQYSSVLFSSVDSGITSPDGLPGNMIAFEDDFSTSGYVLPFLYLQGEGYSLTEYTNATDSVAEDTIGYVFSLDEDTTLAWVLDGRAAAGALQNTDYDDLSETVREQLVILSTSDNWPRHVGIVRNGLDSDLEAGMVDVLKNAHTDPTAADALESFGDSTLFDDFPEGLEAMQERLNGLVEAVSTE